MICGSIVGQSDINTIHLNGNYGHELLHKPVLGPNLSPDFILVTHFQLSLLHHYLLKNYINPLTTASYIGRIKIQI